MAMAQGLHNLPVLYGQKVRRVDNVTNFVTGAKTGGKVFFRCDVTDFSNLDSVFMMDLLDSSWIRMKVHRRKVHWVC